MHHLRLPVAVEPFGQPRRHPAQQGEAAVVVRICDMVSAGVRIAGPVIQVGGVDHVGQYAAVGQHAAIQPDRARTECRRQLGHQLLIENAGAQGREARHQHARIDARAHLRRRQGAGDVGQATGFQQGINFSTNM